MQNHYFKRRIQQVIFTSFIFTLFGCSNQPPIVPLENRKDIHTKAYQLKITPIIGSRQDDSKVVMDMGKIMKIWVAPYKHKKTFVSAHDNFVVAQAPDFVVGETLPGRQNWASMKTPTSKIPFLFRSADMDEVKKLTKKELVEYNNNVYKQQNSEKVAKKRVEESNIYDKEIMNFLNQ